MQHIYQIKGTIIEYIIFIFCNFSYFWYRVYSPCFLSYYLVFSMYCFVWLHSLFLNLSVQNPVFCPKSPSSRTKPEHFFLPAHFLLGSPFLTSSAFQFRRCCCCPSWAAAATSRFGCDFTIYPNCGLYCLLIFNYFQFLNFRLVPPHPQFYHHSSISTVWLIR